jgi:hypothetical protein
VYDCWGAGAHVPREGSLARLRFQQAKRFITFGFQRDRNIIAQTPLVFGTDQWRKAGCCRSLLAQPLKLHGGSMACESDFLYIIQYRQSTGQPQGALNLKLQAWSFKLEGAASSWLTSRSNYRAKCSHHSSHSFVQRPYHSAHIYCPSAYALIM